MPATTTTPHRYGDIAVLLVEQLRSPGMAAVLPGLEDAAIAAAAGAPPAEDRLSHHVLRCISNALRLDRSFLARHPDSAFQMLWNRLHWHDAPQRSAFAGPGAPSATGSHGETPCPGRARWRQQLAAGTARAPVAAQPAPADAGAHRRARPAAGRLRAAGRARSLLCPTAAPLLTAGGGDLRWFDLADGSTRWEQMGIQARGMAWRRDSRWAAVSHGCDLLLIDLERRKLHEVPGDGNEITGCAFSPDGALLAASHLGWQTIIYDDAAKLTPLRSLIGHENVRDPCRLPSRWQARRHGPPPMAARASWDATHGRHVLHILDLEDKEGGRVAFSPDGTLLAACTYDKLFLWSSGQRRAPAVPG